MNRYIENFQNANKELREFLGLEGYADISFKLDHKWNNCKEEVYWVESKDGYSEEVVNKSIYKNDEFTTFLVRSCFGDGDYYIVFDNKNYTEDLEII